MGCLMSDQTTPTVAALTVAETSSSLVTGTGSVVTMPPVVPGGWEAWLQHSLHLLGQHSYLIVFFGSFLENTVILGFLLPGGIAVAVSAAGGREADASITVLYLLGTAGMAGGAVFDYMLGRLGAERVLRDPRLGRLGAFLLGKLDEAKPHIDKHGWWMMLVVHAFGHGRSSLAMAAGASRLPFRRFLSMELPAAAMWSAAFVGGGYFLGGEWRLVTRWMAKLGWAGAAVAVIVLLALWFRQSRSSSSAIAAT
jgi:membrane protein DedA with SNARE-associated domain